MLKQVQHDITSMHVDRCQVILAGGEEGGIVIGEHGELLAIGGADRVTGLAFGHGTDIGDVGKSYGGHRFIHYVDRIAGEIHNHLIYIHFPDLCEKDFSAALTNKYSKPDKDCV